MKGQKGHLIRDWSSIPVSLEVGELGLCHKCDDERAVTAYVAALPS